MNPLQRDELRKNYEMLNFCILKQERENKRVSLQVDVSAFQLQTDCSWAARKQGLFSAFKRNDIQFMRLGIFVDNWIISMALQLSSKYPSLYSVDMHGNMIMWPASTIQLGKTSCVRDKAVIRQKHVYNRNFLSKFRATDVWKTENSKSSSQNSFGDSLQTDSFATSSQCQASC